MSLTSEEECHRIFRIVDYLVKALKVCEKKMGTLVCRKSAAETDGQTIWVNALEKFDNAGWVSLVTEPYILELNLDIFGKLVLKRHTCCPEL